MRLESDRRVANGVAVYACGGNAATMVHELTQAAFAGYEALDPPSGASRETAESVRRDLEAAGGALAWLDSRPVGCLRFVIEADHLHVRRVAVTPELQGLGIGRALMRGRKRRRSIAVYRASQWACDCRCPATWASIGASATR